MSNDIKTLADVQPGGRVRLGDRPEIFAAFRPDGSLAGTAFSAEEAGYWARCKVVRYAAQPSPGGQGDAHDCLAATLGDLLLRGWIDDVSGKLIGEAARKDMAAALAALQPVGEPITVEAVASIRRNGDGDRYIDWLTEGGIADLEVGDVLMVSDRAITDEDGSGEVYAASPAQAVDLDELRRAACVVNVVGQIDGHDVVRRNSVLDVIDTRRQRLTESQAVQT